MKVYIQSFAMIREAIGSRKVLIEFNKTDVSSAIDKLLQIYPSVKPFLRDEEGQLLESLVIAVNGENIGRGELGKYILSENDTIQIIPPAGGG